MVKSELSKLEADHDRLIVNYQHKHSDVQFQTDSENDGLVQNIFKILNTCRSLPISKPVLCGELCMLYNLLCCKVSSFKPSNCSIDSYNITISQSIHRVLSFVDHKPDLLFAPDVTCSIRLVSLFSTVLKKEKILRIHGIYKYVILVIIEWCYISVLYEQHKLTHQLIDLLQTLSIEDIKIPAPKDEQIFTLLPIEVLKHDDISKSSDSFIKLSDVINFVSGLVYFKTNDSKRCQECLININYLPWIPYSTLIRALVLYEEKNYKDVIAICQKLLYIDKLNILFSIKSYLLNFLGSAQLKQGKYHLAIESYREALQEDFSNLIALYNISLQYQQLQLYNQQLETLNFIIIALEDSEEHTRRQDNSNPLQLSYLIEKPSISLPQALYTLAHRCLQLKRYNEAGDRYLDLLAIITDSTYIPSYQGLPSAQNLFLKENNITLPDIAFVYLETCQSLNLSQQYDQCLTISDAALSSYTSDQHEASDDDTDDGNVKSPLSDAFDDLFDDDDHDQRKRHRSDSTSSSKLRNRKWQDIHCQLKLMSYKAEALVKLNRTDEAIAEYEKVIETLQEFPTTVPQLITDTSAINGQTIEPQAKRRRISLTGQHISDKPVSCEEEQYMVSTEWQTLMWSTCQQLTLVLYSLSKYDDCLHFTRLALQLEPENSESWYIYVEILEKLENEREGYKSWLNHRTIPDNNSSIIARQIQYKQCSIRSLEDKDNDEINQKEKKYLQLDIKALQYIAQHKRGR